MKKSYLRPVIPGILALLWGFYGQCQIQKPVVTTNGESMTATSGVVTAGLNYQGGSSQSLVIRTPSSTYNLIDPSTCLNEGCVRGAQRTAELAISDLKSVAGALDVEAQALAGRTSEYIAQKSDYDTKLSSYNTNLNAYNDKLAVYTPKVNAYNADNSQNISDINSFNSRPDNQRDQGTADQLNAVRDNLISRKQVLDGEKALLDQDYYKLLNDKQYLDQKFSELNTEYIDITTKGSNLKFRIGEAYRQLLDCKTYADKMNELIKKYPQVSPISTNLNDVEERLKNMSNKVFDGSR